MAKEAGDLSAQLEEMRNQYSLLQKALEEQSKMSVARVSAKLPPFWTDRPAVWFAQVEAQFDLAGINNDATMFSHVISTLDQRVIGEVEDIVLNPPPAQRYQTLKQELIRRLSVSEEERLRRLLSDEELGDRKPSGFLRHLRSLAGAVTRDENLIRQLWLRRLPNETQAILATQADLSVDKLAELADKIIELHSAPRVASIQPSTSDQTSLTSLSDRMDRLCEEVAAINRRGRSTSRSRSRFSSSSRMRDSSQTKTCWYHRRFGTKATKCIPPCNFTQLGN